MPLLTQRCSTSIWAECSAVDRLASCPNCHSRSNNRSGHIGRRAFRAHCVRLLARNRSSNHIDRTGGTCIDPGRVRSKSHISFRFHTRFGYRNKQSQNCFGLSSGQPQQQLHAPHDMHSHSRPPPLIQSSHHASQPGMIRTQCSHAQTPHVCVCHSPSRVSTVSLLSPLAVSSIGEPGGEGGGDVSGAGCDGVAECGFTFGHILGKLSQRPQQSSSPQRVHGV